MNKLDIRQQLIDQMDWRPTSSADFLALVDRFINRGKDVLFNDAPFLLEGMAHIVTQPDVTPAAGVTGDFLTVSPTDAWAMRRLAGIAGATAWQFNGSWDGRWVEITDPIGLRHRRQIGEFWQGADGFQYMSLFDAPWPNLTDAGMAYRVVSPEYYLPADVVEVRSCKMWGDQEHNLRVISAYDAEDAAKVDYIGRQTGLPEEVFLGQHFALPAPTLAPIVSAPIGDLWGDVAERENAGQFDYCYTNIWRNIGPDVLTPNGLSEVVWESAPSPISTTVTTTNAGNAVRVVTPNIDNELNFGFRSATSVSEGRSGFRKRIYARRYTAAVDGSITRIIESPRVFMLTAEVAGNVTLFLHNGASSNMLDAKRRLKNIHGYRGLRFYPMPDARYEWDLRVQYRPPALVNDYDVVRVGDDGVEALIQKALEFFYDYDKQPEQALLARDRYKDMLKTLTKRYGSLAWDVTHKEPARASPLIGRARSKRGVFETL